MGFAVVEERCDRRFERVGRPLCALTRGYPLNPLIWLNHAVLRHARTRSERCLMSGFGVLVFGFSKRFERFERIRGGSGNGAQVRECRALRLAMSAPFGLAWNPTLRAYAACRILSMGFRVRAPQNRPKTG